MKTKNIIRNILPSITVMIAGVIGAYLVYQNYFEDNIALQVSTYEPATGDELGSSLNDAAAAAAEAPQDAADAMTVPGDVTVSPDTVTLDAAEPAAGDADQAEVPAPTAPEETPMATPEETTTEQPE